MFNIRIQNIWLPLRNAHRKWFWFGASVQCYTASRTYSAAAETTDNATNHSRTQMITLRQDRRQKTTIQRKTHSKKIWGVSVRVAMDWTGLSNWIMSSKRVWRYFCEDSSEVDRPVACLRRKLEGKKKKVVWLRVWYQQRFSLHPLCPNFFFCLII